MGDFFEVNESNFEKEVLKSEQPVVLEFGASWCVPCKRLEPILKQLEQEWKGRVRFAKLDVDESVNLTMKYQVMSVPTVILFSRGEALQRLSGLQTRDKLIEKLSPHL
jgi:thioredoxin 1